MVASATKPTPGKAASTAVPFGNPQNAEQYAEDLTAFLGAPLTPSNVGVTTAWVQSESATFPGYNGLGTELYLPGAKPDPSNSAVYDYPSLASGLTAARDMMLGQSPQTTPLAAAFVKDLRSGVASQAKLINDVQNSGWDGTGGDSYDAGSIASILSNPTTSQPILAGYYSGSGKPPPVPSWSHVLTPPFGSTNLPGAVGNAVKQGAGAVVKDAVGAAGSATVNALKSLATSSFGVRALLMLLGVIFLVMAVKEFTSDDHGPGQTVVTPIVWAGGKAKSAGKGAAIAGAE